MLRNSLKVVSLVVALGVPVYAFAGNVVTDIGNGVGNAAVDVGNAVGNTVKATGQGISDVITPGQASSTSGKVSEDSKISARVKDKITALENNKKIDTRYDLHVKTQDGNVTVSGWVAKQDDVATLQKELAAVDGVKSVKLDVTVNKG